MRSAIALLVLMALAAAPAFGADGNVPRATLSSLGLSDLEVMSDAEGMQVRGQASSFARVAGSSLLFGQLMTADTLNFKVGSSAQWVEANGETDAAGGMLTVAGLHGVDLDLTLDVTFPDTTSFLGIISGLAGGLSQVDVIQP